MRRRDLPEILVPDDVCDVYGDVIVPVATTSLTDEKRLPRRARVREPAIAWTVQ